MLSLKTRALLTRRLNQLVKQYLQTSDHDVVDKTVESFVITLETVFDLIDRFSHYPEPPNVDADGNALDQSVPGRIPPEGLAPCLPATDRSKCCSASRTIGDVTLNQPAEIDSPGEVEGDPPKGAGSPEADLRDPP